MNFSEAIEEMRQGKKIRRKSWPESCYMAIVKNEDKDTINQFQNDYSISSVSISVLDDKIFISVGNTKTDWEILEKEHSNEESEGSEKVESEGISNSE